MLLELEIIGYVLKLIKLKTRHMFSIF